ncbi:MAG: PmoA family protein [Limisphaerales bacterium]
MHTPPARFRRHFRPDVGTLILGLLAGLSFAGCATSGDTHPSASGRGFTADQSSVGVVIKHGGQPFAEYVIGEVNKPYLYPVYGPTGRSMTRAYPMQKVEGEKTDHPHHRGIYFGHENINGSDSWMERNSFAANVPDEKLSEKQKVTLAKMGAIKHRAFKNVSADATHAVIVSENDYVNSKGVKSVTEIRTLTFRVVGDTRLIDWDQEFVATGGDVTFGDSKDAGLSIRVAHSMAVDTKLGGRLVTSTGAVDKDAWSKRAPWADYSGPVEGETLGVAILNHPASFRHPTSWHARTYGLFTANCFGTLDKNDPNGPHTLKKGEKLFLHHRFVLHKGDEKAADIAAAYERYAKEKK